MGLSPSFDSLLRDLPASPLTAERFDTLTRRGAVRIERIVSTGQASPDGFWYDQGWDEFVLLVAGAARLTLDGAGERLLAPGDWVMIPAGTRHRVAWTDPVLPTVWLAVHVGEPDGGEEPAEGQPTQDSTRSPNSLA